ncbi:MAG: hypothetical protein RLY87_658 [Chloroflexota bacterium]|jgi:rhodanese-related sulfurtransferase
MKLTVAQLATLIAEDAVCLVDVRDVAEFLEDGHIPGALNIPVPTILEHVVSLMGDRPIACMCASGMRSKSATRLLRLAGVTQVYDIIGGYAAWQAAGYTCNAT